MTLQDAMWMAEDLIEEWLPGQGWRLRFDNAKRRCGICRPMKKEIGLSRHYVRLNNEAEVRDTILHEIAHALTPRHGHDRVWKAACRKVGARPVRCADSAKVAMPAAPWQATCADCGAVHKRHRLTRKARNGRCACRPYSPDRAPLKWRRAGVVSR